MLSNNDYASLSSGYSPDISSAAWFDNFMQPSYSRPWHKLQASFAAFCCKLSTAVLTHFTDGLRCHRSD